MTNTSRPHAKSWADTFYRYKELYEQGGEEALLDVYRKKPILKNRVDPAVENTVCEVAIEQPTFGQVRASNELRKKGIFISPGGVRSVWLRNDLEIKRKQGQGARSQGRAGRNRRTVSQDHPRRVLSDRIPKEDLPITRRIATRPRRLDRQLQQRTSAHRTILLWKDADGNIQRLNQDCETENAQRSP